MNKNKKPTIALCVIARNKADIITRMLDSTLHEGKPIFDAYYLQDTGSTDATPIIFGQWCVEHSVKYVSRGGFLDNHVGDSSGLPVYKSVTVNDNVMLGDFASARNDSFQMAKDAGHDFAMWIDTDDVIDNPGGISEVVSYMNANGFGIGLMTYDYAVVNGVRVITHKRERILDLRLNGRWLNRVHENYDITEPTNVLTIDTVKIVHLRSEKEAVDTGRRNNLIMTQQLKEDGIENFPDKMLNDLAFDHWERAEWQDSIKYYKILLKRNVNFPPEHIFNILLKVSRAYFSIKNFPKAVSYAFKAIQLSHDRADAYLMLAEIYAAIGNWDQVEHYADKVLELGMPNTAAPVNEADFTLVPLRMKMQVQRIRGKYKEAIQLAKQIQAMIPGNPEIQNELFELQKESRTKEALLGLAAVFRYYTATNRADYADRLIDAIPDSLLEHRTVRDLVHEMKADYDRKSNHIRFKPGSNKNIVIYAGPHYEQWDGDSDRVNGIGGSEGMTIQMARALAELGNKVTIYNECRQSDGLEFDGVLYKDWRQWNQNINCDVFISLRQPQIFAELIRAKKQYLWLHDTGYGEQQPSYFYSPNKILVLSEFHKEVIKMAHGIEDDSAFFVTRNALNKDAIEHADRIYRVQVDTANYDPNIVGTVVEKRNPLKIIYASSYDRGLEVALKNWKTVREAVPNAELHIYYGWNTFDALMKGRQGTPAGNQMAQFKETILALMDQPGVYDHGRVSQRELYAAFAESAIWWYPTAFAEISCITAMTAQAMGAIPVCTSYAALKETVNGRFGIKTDQEKTVEALIHLLQHPEEMERRREPMMRWAREKFDIDALAKEWDTLFNED